MIENHNLSPAPGRARNKAGLAALFLCALLMASCAKSQMQQILPGVTTMVVAEHYFGPPTRSQELADGTMQHVWLLDRAFNHAGGVETRRVYAGHDRDGYRTFVEQDVYVRPWSEQQYCRLTIIADKDGRVRRSYYEGPNCDDLPRVRAATY